MDKIYEADLCTDSRFTNASLINFLFRSSVLKWLYFSKIAVLLQSIKPLYIYAIAYEMDGFHSFTRTSDLFGKRKQTKFIYRSLSLATRNSKKKRLFNTLNIPLNIFLLISKYTIAACRKHHPARALGRIFFTKNIN